MTARTAKLIGTIALIAFIAIYALLAMLVAVVLQVNTSKVVELAFYIVAGLLWVVPAGAIIWWMERPRA
jgi:hypothetical protein